MKLDHLVITAIDLPVGVAALERALGVRVAPGGQHAAMGTHNRLLSLGPDLYLEVIAVDPDAPAPLHPRWFDLDRRDGPPRLTHWVCACPDIDAALANAPEGTGTPMDLSRGDLRWRMAVPPTGVLPWDDIAPALIEWQGAAHPAQLLPDRGVRLRGLTVSHPGMDRLRPDWPALSRLAQVTLTTGTRQLVALFDTPDGPRTLSGDAPAA